MSADQGRSTGGVHTHLPNQGQQVHCRHSCSLGHPIWVTPGTCVAAAAHQKIIYAVVPPGAHAHNVLSCPPVAHTY
jgi:hypothetical protein